MQHLLVNGKRQVYTMVDDEDYEWLERLGREKYHQWNINREDYVSLFSYKKVGKKKYYTRTPLARLLMKMAPRRYRKEKISVVDHIDGNPLNNQKSNLRICTSQQNNQNKRKAKGKAFKGVYPIQSLQNPYMAMIGQRVIGYFPTEHLAALAYDFWAVHEHGEFAKTNFPVVAYN